MFENLAIDQIHRRVEMLFLLRAVSLAACAAAAGTVWLVLGLRMLRRRPMVLGHWTIVAPCAPIFACGAFQVATDFAYGTLATSEAFALLLLFFASGAVMVAASLWRPSIWVYNVDADSACAAIREALEGEGAQAEIKRRKMVFRSRGGVIALARPSRRFGTSVHFRGKDRWKNRQRVVQALGPALAGKGANGFSLFGLFFAIMGLLMLVAAAVAGVISILIGLGAG